MPLNVFVTATITLLAYLPLLARPENIVHFFRDVHRVGAITKEVLRQRTADPIHWARRR